MSGAEIDVRGWRGLTCLHHAAFGGDRHIVAALLKSGADLSAKDQDGRTPLDLAEEEGHEEVTGLLRGYGAD